MSFHHPMCRQMHLLKGFFHCSYRTLKFKTQNHHLDLPLSRRDGDLSIPQEPACDLSLDENQPEGRRPTCESKHHTCREREKQSLSCDQREKINQASARTGCSYPGIPSPRSLWLGRRLEVWHRLCVNTVCQLWARRASGQLRRHALLLSLNPSSHRTSTSFSHGFPEFYTRVTDRSRAHAHVQYVPTCCSVSPSE